MKRIAVLLPVLVLLLITTTISAQLFEKKELYPNTKTIKGKYYSGTGGNGYWSLDYVDSIGRVIKKENYHKKQLMSRHTLVYDDFNNKKYDIVTLQSDAPARVDTTWYEYRYAGNRIIYQSRKLTVNDSTVIELIDNQGDTILTYQEKDLCWRSNTNSMDVCETNYILKFKNGILIREEKFKTYENTQETITYSYFNHGRLKRRVIERIPEPELEAIYTGGPGSDDESYKYKLDSKGRVAKFFRIIDEKKYKIAVYTYK